MASAPAALPTEFYANAGWPLDTYPALNPRDFPDGPSFSVMRRTKEQQRAAAEDDENISVFWQSCPMRDGAEIDILFYKNKKTKNSGNPPPLIVAIHGGGTCSRLS